MRWIDSSFRLSAYVCRFWATIRSLCEFRLLKHENDDLNYKISEKVQQVVQQSMNNFDWRCFFFAITEFLYVSNVNCYDYKEGSYSVFVASDGLINLICREGICAQYTPHVIRLGYLVRQYPERVQSQMILEEKMLLWNTLLSCSWYATPTNSTTESKAQ